jgi:hypothetical protein
MVTTQRNVGINYDDDLDAPRPPRANLPEENALLWALDDALAAVGAALEAHGEGCPCDLCHDFQGCQYILRTGRDLCAGPLNLPPPRAPRPVPGIPPGEEWVYRRREGSYPYAKFYMAPGTLTPDLPAEDWLLERLGEVLEACEAAHEAHAPGNRRGCDCDWCWDVFGCRYNLVHCRSVIDGELFRAQASADIRADLLAGRPPLATVVARISAEDAEAEGLPEPDVTVGADH